MKEIDIRQMSEIVAENLAICTKEVLTSDEVAKYMGISRSHLYKLTMRQEIPHYKPTGKLCYFNRAEVEAWLQANRVDTKEEIKRQVQNYCRKGGAA